MHCYDLFNDDLELSMDNCAKKGTNGIFKVSAECENFDDSLILEDYKNPCRMTFQLACLERFLNLQCLDGERFAQRHGKCGKAGSEMFKVNKLGSYY